MAKTDRETVRKYIDIQEFIDAGYLQEVNRQFFHPLGLALAVIAGPKPRLHGVLDCRDDMEGMHFKQVNARQASAVQAEEDARRPVREKALGYWVQPPPAAEPDA